MTERRHQTLNKTTRVTIHTTQTFVEITRFPLLFIYYDVGCVSVRIIFKLPLYG